MKRKKLIELSELEDFIKNSKKDIEKKIKNTIYDKQLILNLNNGKRLRSLVLLLSFKACTQGKVNSERYQKILEDTVFIELAHTASLIHDDIIDDDIKRRGITAEHIKNGIPDALLIGHKMISSGFKIALNHGEKIAKIYVDTWQETSNGQLDELHFNQNELENFSNKISQNPKIFHKYEEIIDRKTASLFSASSKIGVIEAGKNGKVLELLASYGRELGFAYQLADDLLDLSKGEMINSVVVPLMIRFGKTPDIKSLNEEAIKNEIAKNFEKIKQFYIEEIKNHIKNAEKLSKSDLIPDSPFKNYLTIFPSYIINKILSELNIAA